MEVRARAWTVRADGRRRAHFAEPVACVRARARGVVRMMSKSVARCAAVQSTRAVSRRGRCIGWCVICDAATPCQSMQAA